MKEEITNMKSGFKINTMLYWFIIGLLVVSVMDLICLAVGGFSMVTTIVNWVNPDPWYIKIFR